MNTATAQSPMISAANAMSIADAPTAAPSGSCTRSSSSSVTPNLARSASVLMSAAITASTSQATITRETMTGSSDHHRLPISEAFASGRKMAATHATASSRAAMAGSRAGGPPPGGAAPR